MVPPAAVWNPKWLNKTYSIDSIRMELEATVQRIHESMETIRQSCGQDAPACLDVYLNEGLNLSAAIRKHQQLEHIRQQEAARPVAPEQLAGLRHQLTGETPPAPPAPSRAQQKPLTRLNCTWTSAFTTPTKQF